MATKAQEQRIFREAVRAALWLDEFDLTLTWDEPFALRFDDDEETWFGAVTGPDGEGQGLVLVRGPEGLRWIRDVADGAPDEDELDRYTERVGFTLRRIGDVLPARRAALVAAGAASMRGGLVPEFLAKERNKSARDLGPRDARRLTMTMCALTDAFETEMDAFEAEHPSGILPTLHVSGDWRDPEVRFELAAHADDLGRPGVPVRRGLGALDWPVVEGRWSVAVVDHVFAPDEDDPEDAADDAGEREPPRPIPLLIVADTDAKTLVGYLPIVQATPRRAAQAFARGLFVAPLGTQPEQFAAHVTFVDPLLRAFVAEALEADGVHCVTVPRDEAVEHVAQHLDAILAEAAAARERGDVPVDEDAPDDDDFEDDEDVDDHVHGAGCAHGHGDHDDDYDVADEVEAAPDAVSKVLRDAGLSGGGGQPLR